MRPGPGNATPRSEPTFTEAARRAQIVQAAIDTIAEVGIARASLARIGERIGVSKGLIGYHFGGKDELIRRVVAEILEEGKAYMTPRILAAPLGPDMLRAYIASNLAFMREHRNYMVAIVDIKRNGRTADSEETFYGDANMDEFAGELENFLSRIQVSEGLRSDFEPKIMALAIRAAIDAVAGRLAHDPNLDIDKYAEEITTIFDRATSKT
jgi:TetR/AcrR family transcriptional regulator, fatty acid metabolism regulator protein